MLGSLYSAYSSDFDIVSTSTDLFIFSLYNRYTKKIKQITKKKDFKFNGEVWENRAIAPLLQAFRLAKTDYNFGLQELLAGKLMK